MKKSIFLIILYICFILAFSLKQNVQAATSCNQYYQFLGRTKGDRPIFWIIEDISGECWSSWILQLTVVNRKYVCIKTGFNEYKEWNKFIEAFNELEKEKSIDLKKEDISFKKVPIKSKAMNNKYLYSISVKEIIDRDNIKEIDLPFVNGLKTELMYCFPDGLYVDYTISELYYFRRSGYVLIFTNQELTATGLDTMHGFILLKVVN